MELRTASSNIEEASPNIVFPNRSDPRIRKWSNDSNMVTLSPAALDEIANGTSYFSCNYCHSRVRINIGQTRATLFCEKRHIWITHPD